jgi:hypothetical protein
MGYNRNEPGCFAQASYHPCVGAEHALGRGRAGAGRERAPLNLVNRLGARARASTEASARQARLGW